MQMTAIVAVHVVVRMAVMAVPVGLAVRMSVVIGSHW
jgi:hypothetical protein